jgi:glycerophosphoryl diester phosphodiesterase
MQIHAHRGGRGLMPENSIPAFLHAVELGANAIELDVVITADKQVLVSHEPWLSHLNCLSPFGKAITEDEERLFNLYKMNMEEIRKADCGSVPQPAFPFQKNFTTNKPLLLEVMREVENFISERLCSPVIYNIEIKSEADWYGVYQPHPDEFVTLINSVLTQFNWKENILIQSFDMEILREMKKTGAGYSIGLLKEVTANIEKDISSLGFIPDYYNPDFHLLDDAMLKFANNNNIRIIPWTVNEVSDMDRIADMGVYGLITDYPDLAIARLLK